MLVVGLGGKGDGSDNCFCACPSGKGELAVAQCWAKLRATRRRGKSPMIIPRTRPLGFCKATTRPKPRAEAMVAGTWARATCCATVATWCVAGSSSSRRRNVSAVRPDGPGAARLRLQRRFWMMVAMGSSAGCSGWKVVIWSSGGSCGAAGRRLGSRNSSSMLCAWCRWAGCECLPCCRKLTKVHQVACPVRPLLGAGLSVDGCCVRVRVGCKACCRQKFEPVPVLELVHATVPISFGKNPGARRSVEQHAGQKQPKCPSSNAAFRVSGFENGR